MELSRLGSGPEFDFIRRIVERARRTHPRVSVGPGDDCAIIGDLAISTDASVEGVHFRRDWLSAQEIGARAMGAALSDLAAVAAQPAGVLVTLIVPPRDLPNFAQDVMMGAVATAEKYGAALLGGDVTRGEQFAIDVVAIGTVARPVLRSGAKPGDGVWVTGELGGAAAAVAAWLRGETPAQAARVRYAAIHPRIAEAAWLAQHVELHAMIDLSDGLYGDAAHLATASGCAIEIEPAFVPVDAAAGATLEQAVSGGEDYELCFTAADAAVESIRTRFAETFGSTLTRVGTVQQGSGVLERRGSRTRAVEQGGYQHFRG